MADSIALSLGSLALALALSSPLVGSDATSTTRDWRANDEDEESEEPVPPFPSSVCASNDSPSSLCRTIMSRSLPSLDNAAASLIVAASPSFRKALY